jgi:hypothetical protein
MVCNFNSKGDYKKSQSDIYFGKYITNKGDIFIEHKVSYNQITKKTPVDKIVKNLEKILLSNKDFDQVIIPFELEYNDEQKSIFKHCRVLLFNKSNEMVIIGSSLVRYEDHKIILEAISKSLGYRLKSIISHEQLPGMCEDATQKHLEMLSKGVYYDQITYYYKNFKGKNSKEKCLFLLP